jgi:hypothetical protein
MAKSRPENNEIPFGGHDRICRKFRFKVPRPFRTALLRFKYSPPALRKHLIA